MACTVKESDLTFEQKKKILSDLTFRSKDTFFQNKHKYNKNVSSIIIQLFNGHDGYIDIPYMYGKETLGLSNDESKYKKVNIKLLYPPKPCQEVYLKRMYDILMQYHGGNFGMYTGFGKSYSAIHFSSLIGVLPCMITSSLQLSEQMETSASKFAPDMKTHIISKKKIPEDTEFLICLYTRVKLIPKEWMDKIGFLIIDEAHTMCTKKTIYPFLNFKPKYVLSLSATLERPNNMHQMIYAICGKQDVSETFQVHFTVTAIKTPFTPNVILNSNGDMDYASTRTTISIIFERNLYITYLSHILSRKNKMIIMTYEKLHVEILYHLLKHAGLDVQTLYGDKRTYKNCRILIGTIKKIGTGFDESTCCEDFDGEPSAILLMVTTVKQWQGLYQNVGRVFRHPNPLIYLLLDNHRMYEKQWKENEKWYEEQNTTIQEAQFNPNGDNYPANKQKILDKLALTPYYDNTSELLEKKKNKRRNYRIQNEECLICLNENRPSYICTSNHPTCLTCISKMDNLICHYCTINTFITNSEFKSNESKKKKEIIQAEKLSKKKKKESISH